MIKTYLLFAALFLCILSLPVHAETDAVKASIKAIDEFYNETQDLTKDLADTTALRDIRASSLRSKDAAIKSLENLSRVEKPGKRRFQHAYDTAASYMKDQIEDVRATPQTSAEEKARVGGIVEKLLALKVEKLSAIDETKKFEHTEEKIRKPVPSVDKSPYDNNPENGGKGIWER